LRCLLFCHYKKCFSFAFSLRYLFFGRYEEHVVFAFHHFSVLCFAQSLNRNCWLRLSPFHVLSLVFGNYEGNVSAFLLRYVSFGGFSEHFGFAIRYFIVLYFVQSLYRNCCPRLLSIQCVISCSVLTSIVLAYPFHGYNTLF